jgi:hypothetical protein
MHTALSLLCRESAEEETPVESDRPRSRPRSRKEGDLDVSHETRPLNCPPQLRGVPFD